MGTLQKQGGMKKANKHTFFQAIAFSLANAIMPKGRKLTTKEVEERQLANTKYRSNMSTSSTWSNETKRRRAKNKVAKQSRKVNRAA